MTPKLLGKGGKEKNEWGKYRFNISKGGNLQAFEQGKYRFNNLTPRPLYW